jgi:calcineurin-like phosphoesterase family protein
MFLRKILSLFFFFLFFCVHAQNQQSFTVYLIGDAGEDTASGKALLMLEKELKNSPESAVIFLGDNAYPSGFSKKSPDSKLRLESQLRILTSYKGQAYFIPGNHDWDAQKRNGLKKIKEQQVYVDDYLKKNSVIANKDLGAFYPLEGLPGPSTVMLNDSLRLIMIDTQWFLHFHKKNKTGTKKKTAEVFYKRLDSLLTFSESHGEQVLMAAHHPVFTNGNHCSNRQPWRFLTSYTPFKIIGWCGVDRFLSQDITSLRYSRMRKRMLDCMEKHSNIIYAAGHDHNVQFHRYGNNKFIVSGNGSKVSRLKKKAHFEAYFQDDSATGFVKIEYFKGKIIRTSIYRAGQEIKILEGY